MDGEVGKKAGVASMIAGQQVETVAQLASKLRKGKLDAVELTERTLADIHRSDDKAIFISAVLKSRPPTRANAPLVQNGMRAGLVSLALSKTFSELQRF